MQFDDRLATVLRTLVRGEAGARTQYRQLLDLLGSLPPQAAGELVETGYLRLAALAGQLPASVQSQILRGPGLRLRNRTLVAWLAEAEPQVAAAAMATARLTERDWLYLIPRLPLTARGFLRHRRDLPEAARQVLERLGVKDLVLTGPDSRGAAGPVPARMPVPPVPDRRRTDDADLRAPPASAGEEEPSVGFDFETDANATIMWAEPSFAPLAVGMTLGSARPGAIAALDEAGARALARRLPLSGATVTMNGAEPLVGRWRADGAPAFSADTGAFVGHRGRLRRLRGAPQAPPPATADSPEERMRQVLHELRTPVNAIQGFAEIIQQQLFGPTPNEYRALAAAIAVDAARLLAGFEELDRLARLESGAIELEAGACDWREVTAGLLQRLDGVLRPRGARIELAVSGSPFTVALDPAEALRLAWRLLATLAGALAPGEVIDLELSGDGVTVTLRADLPAALRDQPDLFAASAPAQAGAVSAGMFGSGFALRLARAEAAAAGGSLARRRDCLELVLPALTDPFEAHTAATNT